MSEDKMTLEQFTELMKILGGDTIESLELQRIFRNKKYRDQIKEIECFFKTNRKKTEHLIFTTPDSGFHSRVSKIITHQKEMKGYGCYGKIPAWFISRQRIPAICTDNICLDVGECFLESFRNQTGVEPSPEFSYKVTTPKWRARKE